VSAHRADVRDRHAIRRRLAAKFKLIDTRVLLPWSRTTYTICLPAAIDPLLDAAVGDPEENVPYWAIIWPSGLALADMILARPHDFADHPVLELGCGLGLTATAAVATGTRLIATDYGPEALLLCRLNSLTNTGNQPMTLQLNWRQPRTALFDYAEGGFPTVIAADVLYESRDIEPLLRLVERLVAPAGTFWLAEPGREVAKRFISAAKAAGWQDETYQHQGPWPDPGDKNIVVGIHRLRRGSHLF
jgi:predicted nicotinamide N-methyase